MTKPIQLLIDGYNLLFQSDLVGRGRGPRWLERARNRMLKHLDRQLPVSDRGSTLVVFDASQRSDLASDQPTSESTYGDNANETVQTAFATNHPEADDLLEELIRQHPHPKTLTVVSSDNRIRRCASARRAIWVDSETFLATLGNQSSPPGRPEDGEPTTTLDEFEVEYWMEQFRLAPKDERQT